MTQIPGMFRRQEGKELVRPATCDCGQQYEQRQLSARFMEFVESFGPGAVNAVMRDIPDLWVPRNCPPCERKQLQPVPQMASFSINRTRMNDEGRFAENMARLFGAYNRPHDDATVRAYWRALEWSMTDEQFEQAVNKAIQREKKWPVPATLAQMREAA
jgi:hypothetical protein